MKTLKRAWLITWEWSGDHAKKTQKIISVLDYRIGDKRVKEYIEQIYADNYFTLEERVFYLKSPQKRPYYGKYNGRSDKIICGHNPYIYARLVKDILIDGKIFHWKELSK